MIPDDEHTPRVEELLRDFVQTEAGRKKILSSLASPLERALSYRSLVHQVFLPGPIPEGEEVETIELAEVLCIVRPNELHRMMSFLLTAISDQTNEWLMKELEQRAEKSVGSLDEEAMNRIKGERYLMNARTYAELRSTQWFLEHGSIASSMDLLRSGNMGNYQDAWLLVSRRVPDKTLYSMERLGTLAIHITPQSLEESVVETGTYQLRCLASMKVQWKTNPFLRCITGRP